MKIIILGGGISGLSAAWYLKKKFPDAKISLLEKEKRLGGWIQTKQKESFLYEKGPRTFMSARSKDLLELIDEVGLGKEVIFSEPKAKKRYLWHRNKLRSMGSFIPGLIPSFFKELFIPKSHFEDESIYDFALRRFSRKIAETFFDPMTLGIYGGDIRKLSLKSCFPFLHEWEQKSGSVLRGMFAAERKRGGLFTLKRGMGSLIEALQEKLKAEIVTNCPVEKIEKEGVIAGGKFWQADQIISALPGPEIGRLTKKWPRFPVQSMWVVNLGFSEKVLPKEGYGYLVPTQENEALLGMIWDSSIFPRQETLTAMVRNLGDLEWAKKTAVDALSRHLKIEMTPVLVEAYLASEAIPQFEVGYAKRLAQFQSELKEAFPSLILIGNFLHGASVSACIHNAKNIGPY